MMRVWLLSLLLLSAFALPAWGVDSGLVIDPVTAPSAASLAPGDSGMTGVADDLDPLDDPFAVEGPPVTLADPLEPVNRGFFWVNDKLYSYLFKPVARAFRVVPEPVRTSLGNFFSNLGTPVRFANSLLQLKFADAGSELGRFMINSTLGIGGLFDPAKDWGDLQRKEEDLGQTFGHYGVGQGFYLVLPVLGPTTLRDGVGRVGDTFLEPLPYMIDDTEVLIGRLVEQENRLSLDKETYEGIKEQELDPYLFIRNAYAQRRAAQVRR